MKHVPKYLLPKIAPVSVTGLDSSAEKNEGFVPFKKNNIRGRTGGRFRGGRGGGSTRGFRKKADPLRKFGR